MLVVLLAVPTAGIGAFTNCPPDRVSTDVAGVLLLAMPAATAAANVEGVALVTIALLLTGAVTNAPF
jgi:hypothetical protein